MLKSHEEDRSLFVALCVSADGEYTAEGARRITVHDVEWLL